LSLNSTPIALVLFGSLYDEKYRVVGPFKTVRESEAWCRTFNAKHQDQSTSHSIVPHAQPELVRAKIGDIDFREVSADDGDFCRYKEVRHLVDRSGRYVIFYGDGANDGYYGLAGPCTTRKALNTYARHYPVEGYPLHDIVRMIDPSRATPSLGIRGFEGAKATRSRTKPSSTRLRVSTVNAQEPIR
jgi:hypothetical protein